ncbi:putative signal transduction protein with CBS domains [Caldicellulosiruptor obsidiansis OB47]|jgi:CBS domain-containing protein|uniref:Putative signal transduction protein with CBS domains n=1 Tax=Caldicellulosiruptor obsidiansis (strain ATCC BAA-2073 / JCM 16842 / OB47) TaxID=608506 RepID=D9TGJ3_CALOO|nr:CBS domain-containing protein [Caldicellulosiruptor obsidiansis]ADL43313.1 putative signal transduction protein with CBS domains [Caldicellulosiruptor obsidiansis OB47]
MLSNIINKDFIKLLPTDTVKFALEQMQKRKKSVAVIVDENDFLKGIIVKADIYRFLSQPGHYETYPVELAMTKAVITADKNDDIKDVAKLLRENDISAVPVLDDGKVIGLIGLEDIVDYFINM